VAIPSKLVPTCADRLEAKGSVRRIHQNRRMAFGRVDLEFIDYDYKAKTDGSSLHKNTK
jgi:hypothetical protein